MKKMTAARISNKKFKTMSLSGDWGALLGEPEINFSMFIYGESGNGKTNFAIRLAKYLAKFKKVLFYSVEEGINSSIQKTIIRQGLLKETKVLIGQYEPDKFESPFDDLENELSKRASAHFVFIDSLEYADMNNKQLKALRRKFPRKSFITLGRAEGAKALSAAGNSAKYDSGIVLYVKDHIIYNIKPRFGGGEPYDMNTLKK
jgi:hypothetical protein